MSKCKLQWLDGSGAATRIRPFDGLDTIRIKFGFSRSPVAKLTMYGETFTVNFTVHRVTCNTILIVADWRPDASWIIWDLNNVSFCQHQDTMRQKGFRFSLISFFRKLYCFCHTRLLDRILRALALSITQLTKLFGGALRRCRLIYSTLDHWSNESKIKHLRMVVSNKNSHFQTFINTIGLIVSITNDNLSISCWLWVYLPSAHRSSITRLWSPVRISTRDSRVFWD